MHGVQRVDRVHLSLANTAEVVAVRSLCVTGTAVILGQFAAAGSGKFQAGMWIEH